MPDLGRLLIAAGLLLLAAGVILLLFGRLHLPFGRLPGDVNLRGRNWSFSFPVVSCLLLSALLSLILWIAARFRR